MNIQGLMRHSFRLFGRRNRLFFDGTAERIMFLNIAVGDLQDAIRKGQPKNVLGDMLGRIVSRLFCVAEAFKDMPLVEVMARKYPLSHCTYCGQLPCSCPERRPKYRLVGHANPAQMKWGLRKWCSGFARIYGTKNSGQDVEVLMNRLFKEVVELSSIQARIRTMDGSIQDIEAAITLEMADVLAWTIALSNFLEIDLEKYFLARYGNGCPRCHEPKEYSCTAFRLGEVDWSRYGRANSHLVQ